MRCLSELLDDRNAPEISKGIALLRHDDGREGVVGVPLCGKDRGKARVNILAMGDVGGTVLIGMRLLGGDAISSIGIYDLNTKLLNRYEREINQIRFPDGRRMPRVDVVEEDGLFDCDMFVFCASRGVPPIGADGDVRMAQLRANCDLISMYAKMAVKRRFAGIFAVVSDPVDHLCKAALCAGLGAHQIRGFGLGVMNARAAYFAEKDERFAMYLAEGRAFGPHGEDLVIANSIEHYDDDLSAELTEMTIRSNMDTRSDGFKPYIAPALSSGAISLLATLRGEWHYSSVYFGYEREGAFFGCRNRRVPEGAEIEDKPLCEGLFARIEGAYARLADASSM